MCQPQTKFFFDCFGVTRYFGALDLSNRNISYIGSRAISGGSKFSDVDLSKNLALEAISDSAFEGVSATLTFASCPLISIIRPSACYGVMSVLVLDLSSLDAFGGGATFSGILLSGNQLTNLPANLFSSDHD